jgi:hypothetical protein
MLDEDVDEDKELEQLLMATLSCNSAKNFGIKKCRIENGKIIGIDDIGQHRVAYAIHNHRTDEIEFFWTSCLAIERLPFDDISIWDDFSEYCINEISDWVIIP